MKKVATILIVSSLGWASCVKEKAPQQLTKKQVQEKIDSIVAERNIEIEKAGKVDLNLRYKIEVKAKADSILAARSRQIAGDTLKPRVPNFAPAHSPMEQRLKIKTPVKQSTQPE